MASSLPPDPTAPYGSPPYDSPLSGGLVAELPEHVAIDIVTYVRDALVRYGIASEPYLEHGAVQLHLGGRGARVPLGNWAARWLELDEATRLLRAGQIARALAQVRPASSLPPRRRRSLLSEFGPVVGLLVCAGLAYFGYRAVFGDASATDPSSRTTTSGAVVERRERPEGTDTDPRESSPTAGPLDGDARARASRVCAATRARAVRGATLGIADTEGWVVDYLAFQVGGVAPLATHAALTKFVADPSSPRGSRYIWTEEPELAAVDTSENLVTVVAEDIVGSVGRRTPAVRLSFGGALVDAYFRAETRGRYFHLASALTGELGATHAGLFARCFDGTTHHAASWFRGTNDAAAVTSLVYLLGTYADPLHLAPPYSRPVGQTALDRSFALSNIVRVAEHLDRSLLAGLIGKEGGMVMGKAGDHTTITFPFDDANRAARASREITRATNLGGN